jgi:tripartite-type tricarboxylate transporter receptor subunit TctC
MKTLLTAIALSICASGVAAQGYPSKPVTMIVPFAAGGPADTIARIVAAPMGKALGQTVVVENVTGAAGTIAVGRVAKAAPDGYTLSIGHWSTHVINGAVYQLPYDLLADFEPLGMVASNPLLIVTHPSFPAKDLRDLIGWLKANPDRATVGTAGTGSGSHIGGIYFQVATGTKFQYIPYRGTGPAMQDLVGGRIDLMFDQASNSIPQLRNGRIKGYAVTAKARLASAPDVPTVDEAGLPGHYLSIWYGLWAPKGTSSEVVGKLSGAIVASLADADTRKRLADLGQDIPPREQQTPQALAAFHKAEIEKWWPIVKAAGVKPE